MQPRHTLQGLVVFRHFPVVVGVRVISPYLFERLAGCAETFIVSREPVHHWLQARGPKSLLGPIRPARVVRCILSDRTEAGLMEL